MTDSLRHPHTSVPVNKDNMADKPSVQQSQSSTLFDKHALTHGYSLFPSSRFSFPISSFLTQHSHSRSSPSPMAVNSYHPGRPASSMAPPPIPADTKKFDINSLMSPPEPILDSFQQNQKSANAAKSLAAAIKDVRNSAHHHSLPMSPPISPYSKSIAPSTSSSIQLDQSIKDPVLYPIDESTIASSSQPPLFARAELEHHQRIVDDHVRARSASTFGEVQPPLREDYELALTFRSQVMRHFTSNRKGWLRKERALLEADKKAGAQRYHAIMPARPITASKSGRMHRADRPPKPQGQSRVARNSLSGSSSGVAPRPARRISATPEPSRRIVAPNREDRDFNSLPDYCPPLDSLPSRSNSLKVDWKGQPIDLSGDPFANLLHPDEVTLAGNLRLDCATYLTSKRRIFERRLQCLRTGKEFRKTDAQQACKIDVNKASKLWTAFDKVGWLDAHWVRAFR